MVASAEVSLQSPPIRDLRFMSTSSLTLDFVSLARRIVLGIPRLPDLDPLSAVMSSKYAFSKALKEVRFHLCQQSEHSNALRYVEPLFDCTTGPDQ